MLAQSSVVDPQHRLRAFVVRNVTGSSAATTHLLFVSTVHNEVYR